MSIQDTMDKKRIHLRELRRDMASINPKLSLYKKMEADVKKLEEELATLGAQRTAKK